MTSEIAEELSSKNYKGAYQIDEDQKYEHVLLFISDIRSADWKIIQDQNLMDAEIARDMTLQRNLHLTLQPLASMLKFRLPWSEGCSNYLRYFIHM
jgi:hypothetical protein